MNIERSDPHHTCPYICPRHPSPDPNNTARTKQPQRQQQQQYQKSPPTLPHTSNRLQYGRRGGEVEIRVSRPRRRGNTVVVVVPRRDVRMRRVENCRQIAEDKINTSKYIKYILLVVRSIRVLGRADNNLNRPQRAANERACFR